MAAIQQPDGTFRDANGNLVDAQGNAPGTNAPPLTNDQGNEIRDTLNTSVPLSMLEQARETSGGQNYRAPGFVGNYDRTVTNRLTPANVPSADPPPAPAGPSPLRLIGTGPLQAPDGAGGGGGPSDQAGSGPSDQGPTGEAPGTPPGANTRGSVSEDTAGMIGKGLGVAGTISGLMGLGPLGLGLKGLSSMMSKDPVSDPVDPVTGAVDHDVDPQNSTNNNNNSTEATSMESTGTSVGSGQTEGSSGAMGGPGSPTGAGPAGPSGTADKDGGASQNGSIDPNGSTDSGSSATGNGGSTDSGTGGGKGDSSGAGGGMGDGGGGGGGGGDGGSGDGGDGGGGDGCFTGETPVLMADGSSKPISDIDLGDMVMAFRELGALEPRRVTGKMVHADCRIVDLGGVMTTREHPFLMAGGGYEKVEHLGEMDRIVMADGQPWIIRAITPQEGLHTVYNIEVDDLHTYVAGGFRVHNSKAMGGVIGGRRMVGPQRQAFGRRAMAEGGAVQPGPDMRQGGAVPGQGDWNSDNVKIDASPGEEVIPGAVVAFYGQRFFDDLIKNAEAKTGVPRGTDQSGNPPSEEAQESFRATQQPEGSQSQGARLAEGGEVAAHEAAESPAFERAEQRSPDLEAMDDEGLRAHARGLAMKGDVVGHRAVMQHIGRRARGQAPRKMAMGGDVQVPGPDTGSTASRVGSRPPSGFFGGSSGRVGPQRVATPRFGGAGAGGGGIRVPQMRQPAAVHVPSIPAPSAMPTVNAPGPKPQAMPSPPAVMGAGPPTSVAPMAPGPRSAAPRRGPGPLAMIGRRR